MAQLVRAPPCHGGGRRFESDLGRLYGILAQLGEHLPYKQRVTGSSPVGPIWRVSHVSMIAVVAELADAQDLKSCGTNLPCRFDSGLRHIRTALQATKRTAEVSAVLFVCPILTITHYFYKI